MLLHFKLIIVDVKGFNWMSHLKERLERIRNRWPKIEKINNGIVGPGDRLKLSNDSEKNPGNVIENVGIAIRGNSNKTIEINTIDATEKKGPGPHVDLGKKTGMKSDDRNGSGNDFTGKTTQKNQEKHGGNGMQETGMNNSGKSLNEENRIIPFTDSQEPTEIFSEATSQSTSLLLDTAKHLNGLMKDLTKNLPPVDIKHMDVERAQTACVCAKQITELMKVQMEAIKIVKGD